MRSDVEAGAPAPPSFRYWEMLITVGRGPYKGREFAFTTDVVSVGKAPGNDIPLPDETVSRRHLEILHDAKGYLLRDLGSTNGTFLDGAEIREAFLRNGSQVKVGETRFRFRAVQRRVRTEPYQADTLDGLVGATEAMRRVFGLARAVAPLDVTVLLRGEPGTGRRSLAEVIHRRSALRSAPYTLVDCGAEPAARLERLLFHERTGALERPEGGTLALLEPAELPPALQPRLAEAIRRRRSPLSAGPMSAPGGGQRLVALSSRDLRVEVDRGRLDPQLSATLDRVRLDLPPLRERLDELPALVAAFLADLGQADTPAGQRVASAVAALGERLVWEGNLAQLRELVAALTALEAAPAAGGFAPAPPDDLAFDPAQTFGENKLRWVEAFERRYVDRLLARHDGNVSAAARAADMDRKHLHRLLKRYGQR
jgi:DNA-binding NtrC family response regulator